MLFIMLFQAIMPNFAYVNAANDTKELAVCSWPSEMMSNYFNFQREAISILLWAEANGRLSSVSFRQWGLFSEKVLKLPAIDLLYSSIVEKSFLSNIVTSGILFDLISLSVAQSNVEWLFMLYKDRSVVRDYKEMLDIETMLFDVAYFRSKQISLTRPMEWNLSSSLSELIKDYQKKWLLEPGATLNGKETMADILGDLVMMNTAMKHFILIGGKVWKSGLDSYYGCLWTYDENNCVRAISVLKFSTGATEQLYNDYRGVNSFSPCNSYAKFFRNNINKTINNNLESVKSSMQDVKISLENWNRAFLGFGKWSWDFRNNRKNICEWMSDYEMVQLRAYRWPNWTCWKLINASASLNWPDISSAWSQTKKYSEEKKAQRDQKQKLEETKESESQKWGATEKMTKKISSEDKKSTWRDFYWKIDYNPEFSLELNSNFENMFDEIMNQYWQSLENAVSSDISDLLPKGKWILDQVNTSIGNTDELKKKLQKIVDYQCSN